MRRAVPANLINGVPTTFQVGGHAVIVCLQERRWSLTVDDERMPSTYETQAEAWEAGVRESARRDALPPSR